MCPIIKTHLGSNEDEIFQVISSSTREHDENWFQEEQDMAREMNDHDLMVSDKE